MLSFLRPLQLALPCSACVRIPADVAPPQQARDVCLMRLAASLIGAEAVERLEGAIAPQSIGQLARLIAVGKAGVHPAGRRKEREVRADSAQSCEKSNEEALRCAAVQERVELTGRSEMTDTAKQRHTCGQTWISATQRRLRTLALLYRASLTW